MNILPTTRLPPIQQHHLPPPQPKQRKQAEQGKGKASTRAKSGCWTCRIRRKKCDEMRTPEGFCQTCVRLRLECLGWGSRRPDWMREKNNVIERREKIKDFLATHGMIKGHAGSIARNASENPPPILNLGFDGISASSSRSSPTLSPSSESEHRRPHFDSGYNSLITFASIASDAAPYTTPHGYDSGAHGPMLSPPIMLHPVLAPPVPSAPAIDDSLGYLPDFTPSAEPERNLQGSNWISPFTPALASSFGNMYSGSIDVEEDLESPEDGTMSLVPTSAGANALPTMYLDPLTGTPVPLMLGPSRWLSEMPNAQFVTHYMKEVLPIQYLLGNVQTIRQWTYKLAQTSEATRSALCLLAALHQHCMSQMSIAGTAGSTSELDVFYSQTRTALRSARTLTEGDAMASLHIISSFLFAGGRGPWHEYLDIASKWVQSVLYDSRYSHPRDALLAASESVRFIVRATFWFDVWSSCSQLRQPQFLHVYRELFGQARGAFEDEDPATGMLEVMGCSNENFLAMAEIAALAHWKEEQRKLGKLSYPRLVERGQEIEARFLLKRGLYEPGDVSYLGRADSNFLGSPDGVETRRRLVSNVFRASARVYLHSVISGGYPDTPEIVSGVQDTINCLRAVPGYSDASRVVVRSVVFSICICGCLTDDPEQRQFFLNQLDALGQEAEVLGNCFQAKKLMERVWEKRKEAGGVGEVRWRETMCEGPGILLLA